MRLSYYYEMVENGNFESTKRAIKTEEDELELLTWCIHCIKYREYDEDIVMRLHRYCIDIVRERRNELIVKANAIWKGK